MSAPVFVIDFDVAAGTRAGDVVTVEGAEARHAVAVTRLGPGEVIELVDGAGRRLHGVVETAAKDTLTVRVEQIVDEPEPSLRVVVVQAMLKGEHGDLALDQLTQVGVDEIVPWAAEHAVVRLDDERAAKAATKWQMRIVTAAKQSRRARWPQVAAVASTQQVRALLAAADSTVVLHETASTALSDAPLPLQGTVVLVVGPEGGIAPGELDELRTAGAVVAHLGPTVLRGSLAGAVGTAVVLARTRWRSPGMAGSKP